MALYFSGSTGNYAEITSGYGNTLSNTSGTFSVWLKPTSYNYGIAVATKGRTSNGVFVETNNAVGNMYVGIDNLQLVPNAAFAADTWVHLCFGGQASTNFSMPLVYINGELSYMHTTSTKWATSAANLYLGRWDSGTFPYLGWIGDIRVWNRRLTPEEVLSVYRNQDVTSGLVERWPLTESSGSTITGTIGGNNGTITGTPTWGGTAIPYGSAPASGSVRTVNIRGGADQ